MVAQNWPDSMGNMIVLVKLDGLHYRCVKSNNIPQLMNEITTYSCSIRPDYN